jgi:hypothetical protein
MITDEALLDPIFEGGSRIHDAARWATYGLSIAGVLLIGKFAAQRAKPANLSPSATTLVNQKS